MRIIVVPCDMAADRTAVERYAPVLEPVRFQGVRVLVA